jgi:hypothetical protein
MTRLLNVTSNIGGYLQAYDLHVKHFHVRNLQVLSIFMDNYSLTKAGAKQACIEVTL